MELNKFEPFPKNPPISKVFREIGYVDELGSGMRNTNKYNIHFFIQFLLCQSFLPLFILLIDKKNAHK